MRWTICLPEHYPGSILEEDSYPLLSGHGAVDRIRVLEVVNLGHDKVFGETFETLPGVFLADIGRSVHKGLEICHHGVARIRGTVLVVIPARNRTMFIIFTSFLIGFTE